MSLDSQSSTLKAHSQVERPLCHGKQLSIRVSRTNIQVLLDNNNKPPNGAFSQAQMFDHGMGFWQKISFPFIFKQTLHLTIFIFPSSPQIGSNQQKCVA